MLVLLAGAGHGHNLDWQPSLSFQSPTSLHDLSIAEPRLRKRFVSTNRTIPEEDTYVGPVSFPAAVASGDPTQTSVILWTKAFPLDASRRGMKVSVRLIVGKSISENTIFDKHVKILDFVMTPQRIITSRQVDFTVKVELRDLEPNSFYYYQFAVGKYRSPVGRTKTLPSKDDANLSQVKFATVSCSNWVQGYFWAYYKIALRGDIDFVLHLGDYIYEYGNRVYGEGSGIKRIPIPNREIFTLEDYRLRHAQYKTDEHLQMLHRLVPFFNAIDDHEVRFYFIIVNIATERVVI